ncbi:MULTISPECIES: DUF397 domain-containing protein [unclassified Streptomyces]|uniref:DUF397 domain-containing protein n=1 Tax=unclassified Streptomyces TaxID=2593676 RepID=UPI000DB9BCA0|nr:DUF397 domain-containing protein [Streptomyces sp. PsTaAH-137]MYT71541.1 DUF397 domain-containing protein [Streptomyces sp. SID8367]
MQAHRSYARTSGWFKSSYSGGNTTECVETAFTHDGVLIRDSTRPDGPRLRVSGPAWAGFVVAPPHIRLSRAG